MSTAGHGYGGDYAGDAEAGEPLPAILERAQQDRQWHGALGKLGFRQVRAAFARQLRDDPQADVFIGVSHLKQYPSMDFVRAWMRAQRKRALKRLSWTFLGAMLATIVAAITFAVGCRCIAGL